MWSPYDMLILELEGGGGPGKILEAQKRLTTDQPLVCFKFVEQGLQGLTSQIFPMVSEFFKNSTTL